MDGDACLTFDRSSFVLPSGTRFEERMIVTRGDCILGNHVQSDFGFKTDGRIFTGQGVEVEGSLEADGDLRLDQSSHVKGDLVGGANIYLAERCFIKGDLELKGDLDVGDDVKIGGQLKAQGWVNKRNPIPLVFYILIYLLELLRLGQSEEVDRILKELEESEDGDIAVDEVFLFIPDHTQIGLQSTLVKGGLKCGAECRLLGNFRIEGPALLGEKTRVLGAFRCQGDIEVGPDCEIQGNLESDGHITIGEGTQVLGSLRAKTVTMYPDATIDGKILAENGVQFVTEKQLRAESMSQKNLDAASSKTGDLVDLLG